MNQSYVVLPDVRPPYEDTKVVRAVLDFLAEYQPDEVIHIGGEQPAGRDENNDTFVTSLRDTVSCQIVLLEDNNNDPSDFNADNVTVIHGAYDIAPGWQVVHCSEDHATQSHIPGNTALNTAKMLGKSVISGHTRRTGKGSQTRTYEGKIIQSLTGMEIGHLRETRKADRQQAKTERWQHGFGLVYVTSEDVYTTLVPISHGKFTVCGVAYDASNGTLISGTTK